MSMLTFGSRSSLPVPTTSFCCLFAFLLARSGLPNVHGGEHELKVHSLGWVFQGFPSVREGIGKVSRGFSEHWGHASASLRKLPNENVLKRSRAWARNVRDRVASWLNSPIVPRDVSEERILSQAVPDEVRIPTEEQKVLAEEIDQLQESNADERNALDPAEERISAQDPVVEELPVQELVAEERKTNVVNQKVQDLQVIFNRLDSAKDEVKAGLNTAINTKVTGMQQVNTLAEQAKTMVKQEVTRAQTSVKNELEDIKQTIQDQAQTVKTQLQTSKDNIKTALDTKRNNIQTILTSAKGSIGSQVQQTKAAVKGNLNQIKTQIQDDKQAIKAQISSTKQNVKAQIQANKGQVQAAKDQLKQQLQQKKQQLQQQLQNKKQQIQQQLANKRQQLNDKKQQIQNNKDQIKNQIQTNKQNIKQQIEEIKQAIKDQLQSEIALPIGIAGLVISLVLPIPAALGAALLVGALSILPDLGLLGLILGLVLPLYLTTHHLKEAVSDLQAQINRVNRDNLNRANFNFRREDTEGKILPAVYGQKHPAQLVQQRPQPNPRKRIQGHSSHQAIPSAHTPAPSQHFTNVRSSAMATSSTEAPFVRWNTTPLAVSKQYNSLHQAYSSGPNAYYKWYQSVKSNTKKTGQHLQRQVGQHIQILAPQAPMNPSLPSQLQSVQPTGSYAVDYAAQSKHHKYEKYFKNLNPTTASSVQPQVRISVYDLKPQTAAPVAYEYDLGSLAVIVPEPSLVFRNSWIPTGQNNTSLESGANSISSAAYDYRSSEEVTPFQDYSPEWKPVAVTPESNAGRTPSSNSSTTSSPAPPAHQVLSVVA